MSHLHADQNCDKSEGTQNTDTCRTEEILLWNICSSLVIITEMLHPSAAADAIRSAKWMFLKRITRQHNNNWKNEVRYMRWSSGISGLKPSKINIMFEAIGKPSDEMQKRKKTHAYLNETEKACLISRFSTRKWRLDLRELWGKRPRGSQTHDGRLSCLISVKNTLRITWREAGLEYPTKPAAAFIVNIIIIIILSLCGRE